MLLTTTLFALEVRAQVSFQITPSAGPAGLSTLAEGCGWSPGVVIRFSDGAGNQLSETTSAANGCFSAPLPIPASAAPGQITIRADGASDSALSRYTVLEPDHFPADPRGDGLVTLREASEIDLQVRIADDFPESVRMRLPITAPNPVERARELVERHADFYGLGASSRYGMVPAARERHDRFDYVTLQQTIDGVEVVAGQLSVIQYDGIVVGTLGKLITEDPDVDTQPTLSKRDAVDAARSLLDLPDDAEVTTPPNLVVFDPRLVGLQDVVDAGARPAWRLALRTPRGTRAILVDAVTGEHLFGWSFTQPGFNLDIRDAGYVTADGTCYFWTSEPQAANENGIDSSYTNDLEVTRAYNLSQEVYNFYAAHFGRDSWDDDGDEIEIYVHAIVDGTAAWWSGSPFCNILTFSDDSTLDDIFAHEFTHAVISDTSKLIYANESGAINESFADIFGALVDDNDWYIGEQPQAPGEPLEFIRNMADPDIKHYADRKAYCQDPGAESCDDNGGVHDNSGIMNYAAFLMADGSFDGPGFSAGFGRTKLRSLAYPTMISMPAGANFGQVRDKMVWTAHVWQQSGTHGFDQTDVCRIRTAWSMVGIGAGDLDCDQIPDDQDPDDDNDYAPDPNDNCPGIFNPFQEDTDNDGLGDACDADIDQDGISNPDDNCEKVPNPLQQDSDNNGIGDACEDSDNDKVLDVNDNCPDTYNPYQQDSDGDGQGDKCDADADNDGVPNIDDNCPLTENPDQTDTDGGGLGDACDPNPDHAFDDFIIQFGDTLVDFTVQPDAIEMIQIDLCAAGCPEDWMQLGAQVQVSLSGLPAGSMAAVSAPDGHQISQFEVAGAGARGSASQTLQTRFDTTGAGRYVIHVIAHPDQPASDVTLEIDGRVVIDGLFRDRFE